MNNEYNTVAELSVLTACTADVRQWYLQNGLQPNPDKSEVLTIGFGTTHSCILRHLPCPPCPLPASICRQLTRWKYWSRARSTLGLQQPRDGSDTIVQLSRTSHPTHDTTPAGGGARTDVYARPQSTVHKFAKFGCFSSINHKIINNLLRRERFQPNFRRPLAAKLLMGPKKVWVLKWWQMMEMNT